MSDEQQRFIVNLDTISEARFALVSSRFNESVVTRLVDRALDCLDQHGVEAERVSKISVPGAWELPLVAKKLAETGKADAIIVLGAVIRGDTPHFDFVAGEAARGCARVMLDSGVPVIFGVLTTDNMEQALARAADDTSNRGWSAAMTALEMVSLVETLRHPS